MTGYITKLFLYRGYRRAAAELLCQVYNHATDPAALRTDRECELRCRQAELILAKLRKHRLPHCEAEGGRLAPFHFV